MVQQRKMFPKESAAFAQHATRQFAEIHKALRALRDQAPAVRKLNVPTPKALASQRYTKTVHDLSIVSNGTLIGLSQAQKTSLLLQSLREAQRIL